jgi:hypothetical protein
MDTWTGKAICPKSDDGALVLEVNKLKNDKCKDTLCPLPLWNVMCVSQKENIGWKILMGMKSTYAKHVVCAKNVGSLKKILQLQIGSRL